MHRVLVFAVVLICPLSELQAEERNTQRFEIPGGYEVVPAVRSTDREQPTTRHAVEWLHDEAAQEPRPMSSRSYSGEWHQRSARSGYSF